MQIDNLKKQLTQELETITTELKSLGVENPEVEGDWIPTPSEPSDGEPDPNDLGDRSEDWQEVRGVLDLLETRYNNIKRALEKISGGTFGHCEICDKEIEADRLDANPSARTCKEHLADEDKLPLV